MNRKQVYHVDNIVKITTPEIVVRVGYPLTKAQALEVAEKEYSDKIHAFMREVGAEEVNASFGEHSEYGPRLYHALVDAMAAYWLKKQNYGGKERKIYTERDERVMRTTWRVLSKRVVKTGTYNHGGYCGGGWDGEPDFQPPFLDHEKSHVLLTLEPTSFCDVPDRVEIEAANVEMYFDPEIAMAQTS